MLEFRPIELGEQKEYRRILNQCAQICSDYSFINVWGWQELYGLKIARTKNLFWIRQTIPYDVFWAPIGNWKQIDWLEYTDILRGNTFIRVPEILVNEWKKYFHRISEISEDRDQWDYLYLVQELIDLKGNRFHKKKNLFSQFEKKYKYQFVELKEDWINEAENFQVDWCYYKDCDDKEILIKENKVILKVLEKWDSLEGVLGGGLVVDGNLIAYTIAEPLDSQSLVIHFEKGCPTYKGVYQAINKIFLLECAKRFKFVNREQDLGDKGLRRAKMSYNPCCFLKKFSVKFL